MIDYDKEYAKLVNMRIEELINNEYVYWKIKNVYKFNCIKDLLENSYMLIGREKSIIDEAMKKFGFERNSTIGYTHKYMKKLKDPRVLPICSLGLQLKTCRLLLSKGYTTVEKLIKFSHYYLTKIPELGETRYKRMADVMAEYGFVEVNGKFVLPTNDSKNEQTQQEEIDENGLIARLIENSSYDSKTKQRLLDFLDAVELSHKL